MAGSPAGIGLPHPPEDDASPDPATVPMAGDAGKGDSKGKGKVGDAADEVIPLPRIQPQVEAPSKWAPSLRSSSSITPPDIIRGVVRPGDAGPPPPPAQKAKASYVPPVSKGKGKAKADEAWFNPKGKGKQPDAATWFANWDPTGTGKGTAGGKGKSKGGKGPQDKGKGGKGKGSKGK